MTPDEETASAIVYRDCEHDGFPCRECMVIRIAAALARVRAALQRLHDAYDKSPFEYSEAMDQAHAALEGRG